MKSNAPRGLNREKMRALYKEGYCIEEIARIFKCRTNAVMHHVYDLVVPCITMIRSNSKLTEKQVNAIRKLFIKKKVVASLIAEEFNISQSTVLNVAHGIFYRWVPGEVIDKDGMIHVIPKGFHTKTLLNKIGVRKSGPNNKTKRLVRAGVLIPLAKKHKVATCTISRWMRNGRMTPSGKLLKRKIS